MGMLYLGEWIGEALFDERVRFTGKDYDEVTGLYYFNARWYDPQLGRFTSEDPVRDGMNWYVYVRNNPLRFIDPTGLENVLINNEGLFPTIDEIDIGAGDFADGALAGLASVANIPSSLANTALQAVGTAVGTILGAADAVIDAVDNLIPDSMSLTGGGLKEDLFVTGLFVGMNPQTTSGFMLSMKYGIKSATGKIFGGKGNIAKGVQKSLKDQAVDLIPQNANRNRIMLRSSRSLSDFKASRRFLMIFS